MNDAVAKSSVESPLKPLIVTADDFAQSAEIDAGIVALILKNRVTAASCLTMSPRWPAASRLLTPQIRGLADIGLHLDFTQYAGYTMPLPVLMLRAFLHSLSTQAIVTSIHQQLDRFEAELGLQPDYVDGHQHVHQLPQIRDALLKVLVQRYGSDLPWLRIARPYVQDGFKGRVIAALGANALEWQAKSLGFRCTQKLLGVYGFDSDEAEYIGRLDRWLGLADDSTAIDSGTPALMCHPAITPVAAITHQEDDSIYPARLREYEVLQGDAFDKLITRHGFQLSRGNVL